jgi:glycosyltransferase involved in cell wall biosynthesis
MIRVCHIISGLGTGGAEMMLYNLVGRMDRTRFAPSVVSLIDTGTVGERIGCAGVPVRALGMKRGVPSPSGLFNLKKALRELRPDVIQGWMYHGNLAATLGAALAGGTVPVVWGVHHSLYDIARERPLTRTVIRLCARLSHRPAATVYVSRLSAAQHAEFGFRDKHREIIPNGFDGERFRPDPERRSAIRRGLGVGDGQILIGLIARYHPMKDHGNFLRAAARLAGTRPEARFLLAGTGVDTRNEELTGMIESLGLAGRADLLGERGDVADLMAALDILCMSSSHGEAFPMVVGEAMASGLPCAVTDVGDVGWLVGETGRVVPPRNVDILAAALGELVGLGSEGRRILGMAARRRIRDEFSLERSLEAYQTLYEQLAGR